MEEIGEFHESISRAQSYDHLQCIKRYTIQIRVWCSKWTLAVFIRLQTVLHLHRLLNTIMEAGCFETLVSSTVQTHSMLERCAVTGLMRLPELKRLQGEQELSSTPRFLSTNATLRKANLSGDVVQDPESQRVIRISYKSTSEKWIRMRRFLRHRERGRAALEEENSQPFAVLLHCPYPVAAWVCRRQ